MSSHLLLKIIDNNFVTISDYDIKKLSLENKDIFAYVLSLLLNDLLTNFITALRKR